MRSPISVGKVVGLLSRSGLDPPILSQEDPRWERLGSGVDPGEDPRDRFRGALLGLAVGDALGTPLEFKRPGTFTPLTDMLGGGPFHLKAGQWTDHTSMALCLAESLVECRGFDPVNQLPRSCRWYREGRLSSTWTCCDIGDTVRSALERFERTRDPYCRPTGPHTAGNGSIIPAVARESPSAFGSEGSARVDERSPGIAAPVRSRNRG